MMNQRQIRIVAYVVVAMLVLGTAAALVGEL